MVWVAYLVLFIAIGLESWSFRTAFREANKSRGTRTLKEYIQDTRQPELPVVLLEDIGALLGLVLALFGVTMAVVTGDARWDGVGSLAIGTLLLVIAVFLAFEMSGAAGRGVGAARAGDGHQGRAQRPARRRLDHPHAHAAHRTGRAAGRGEDRRPPRPARPASWPSSSTRPSSASARRSPTAKWIYLEPDIERAQAEPADDAQLPQARGAGADR